MNVRRFAQRVALSITAVGVLIIASPFFFQRLQIYDALITVTYGISHVPAFFYVGVTVIIVGCLVGWIIVGLNGERQ